MVLPGLEVRIIRGSLVRSHFIPILSYEHRVMNGYELVKMKLLTLDIVLGTSNILTWLFNDLSDPQSLELYSSTAHYPLSKSPLKYSEMACHVSVSGRVFIICQNGCIAGKAFKRIFQKWIIHDWTRTEQIEMSLAVNPDEDSTRHPAFWPCCYFKQTQRLHESITSLSALTYLPSTCF